MEVLQHLLKKRFQELDFKEAADEARIFLHDAREVELWSREFFLGFIERIPAPDAKSSCL